MDDERLKRLIAVALGQYMARRISGDDGEVQLRRLQERYRET